MNTAAESADGLQHRSRPMGWGALGAALFLSGCLATPVQEPVAATPLVPTPLAPSAGFSASVIGAGSVHNQFVLKDPASGQPAANRPYHLVIKGMALSSNPKKSWDGITDLQGQTVTVRSHRSVRPADVLLVQRFGEGQYGEVFRLSDPVGNPLANVSVSLTLCDGRVFHAVTDAKGYAGYVATQSACKVKVSLEFAELRLDP